MLPGRCQGLWAWHGIITVIIIITTTTATPTTIVIIIITIVIIILIMIVEKTWWAAIAQLGERQTEDLKVPGLIPGLSTAGFSDGYALCFLT